MFLSSLSSPVLLSETLAGRGHSHQEIIGSDPSGLLPLHCRLETGQQGHQINCAMEISKALWLYLFIYFNNSYNTSCGPQKNTGDGLGLFWEIALGKVSVSAVTESVFFCHFCSPKNKTTHLSTPFCIQQLSALH